MYKPPRPGAPRPPSWSLLPLLLPSAPPAWVSSRPSSSSSPLHQVQSEHPSPPTSRQPNPTAPTQKDTGTQANVDANTRDLVSSTIPSGRLPLVGTSPAPTAAYRRRSNVSRRACVICREKKSKWYVLVWVGGGGGWQEHTENERQANILGVGGREGGIERQALEKWDGGRSNSPCFPDTSLPPAATQLPYAHPHSPTHLHTQENVYNSEA